MGDDEDFDAMAALGATAFEPDVSWHVLEEAADERLLGCLGTRRTGDVAAFELYVAEGSPDDVRVALVNCAEAAAKCHGATSCQMAMEFPGYVRSGEIWTKDLGPSNTGEEKKKPFIFDDPGLPPVPVDDDAPKEATEDDLLGIQLELASVARDLVDHLDKNSTEAPKAPAEEESLEDLVGSLLKVLKTEKGKNEFNDLAAKQHPIAPRAGFVPRPPEEAGSGVTATVGNARAFAELLASDARFQAEFAHQ